jgi:hypothetical protein
MICSARRSAFDCGKNSTERIEVGDAVPINVITFFPDLRIGVIGGFKFGI